MIGKHVSEAFLVPWHQHLPYLIKIICIAEAEAEAEAEPEPEPELQESIDWLPSLSYFSLSFTLSSSPKSATNIWISGLISQLPPPLM